MQITPFTSHSALLLTHTHIFFPVYIWQKQRQVQRFSAYSCDECNCCETDGEHVPTKPAVLITHDSICSQQTAGARYRPQALEQHVERITSTSHDHIRHTHTRKHTHISARVNLSQDVLHHPSPLLELQFSQSENSAIKYRVAAFSLNLTYILPPSSLEECGALVPRVLLPCICCSWKPWERKKNGILLASNTRHPGSGEWRVDVAVMGGEIGPIVSHCVRFSSTHTHPALVSSNGD